MKKIVIVFLLVISFSWAKAQKNILSISGKIGYSASNMHGSNDLINSIGDNNYDTENETFNHIRNGLTLGISVEKKFCNYFGIDAEFLYTQKGCHLWPTQTTNLNDQYQPVVSLVEKSALYRKLDYLSLPVLGKVYITQRLNISLGLYYDFLISAKEEGWIRYQGGNKVTFKDHIDAENTNFGWLTGIGYEYPLSQNRSLTIDFRGNWSILPALDYRELYTQSFQLTMGYKFNLLKNNHNR